MEAKVKIFFANISPEEAQKYLWDFLDNLKAQEKVKDYEFEIKTEKGTITHRCILDSGKVIA